MGKIIKLPDSVANKIAAGEVVERPASVLKELVENSIDAHAGKIEINIKQAGKELIQIIDDGEGMIESDALLAFERHATSKIKLAEDLENISTLGFRGEALPSIASVSIIEVKTRTEESQTGIHLYFTGGTREWEKPAVMNRGTHVSVKNLFFNTPARRNFLRSDTAELQRILATLKRFFLGYPHIHFKVTVNNNVIYDLPSQNIDDRISQIFGKQVYNGLIHFIEEKDDIILDGYIAKPDLARNSRGMEFIYLNLRPIENKSLNFAVIQAFGNLLERRQYPPYIMYITIPPHQVDINVHPTKMEVKFQKEQFMFHLFSSSVKKALTRENVIPAFRFQDTIRKAGPGGADSPDGFSFSQERPPVQTHFKQGKLDLSKARHQDGNDQPFTLPHVDDTQDSPPPALDRMEEGHSILPLFQLHSRYILAQIESGLVIIDQHVAHERILYEKILKVLNNPKSISSQQLLFPQTLELLLEDYLIFTEIKDLLKLTGFSTSELSGRTIVIDAIPTDVRVGYEGKILLEILDEYKINKDQYRSSQERMAASFACKNAIKSGEKISYDEMKSLIDRLFLTSEPYFCPHGRPVIITLPLEELDRKFKRIK